MQGADTSCRSYLTELLPDGYTAGPPLHRMLIKAVMYGGSSLYSAST